MAEHRSPGPTSGQTGAGGIARRTAKRLLEIVRDSYRYVTFPVRFSDSRGVFHTFAEAVAAAPRGKPIGYNNVDAARMYVEHLNIDLADYDFPALYYLGNILSRLDGSCSLLDFGGNIGVHFLKFKTRLDLDRVKWIICDLPEITRSGEAVCQRYSNVRFINDISDCGPVDIVLAIGSVQYIEDFVGFLHSSGVNPRYILIGQVLLHDGERFVTLQNGGHVYYPQFVFERVRFISAFNRAGYTLLDSWHDSSNGCSIPFHPEFTITSRGLFFAKHDLTGPVTSQFNSSL